MEELVSRVRVSEGSFGVAHLASLVLGDLVLGVLLAVLALAVGPARLRDVDLLSARISMRFSVQMCPMTVCEKCVCRRMPERFVRRHRSCNSTLPCPSSNHPRCAAHNVDHAQGAQCILCLLFRICKHASRSQPPSLAIPIHPPITLPHPAGSSFRGRHTAIAHRFGFGGVAYHFDGISVSSKGGEVVEGRRWAWEWLHCYSV